MGHGAPEQSIALNEETLEMPRSGDVKRSATAGGDVEQARIGVEAESAGSFLVANAQTSHHHAVRITSCTGVLNQTLVGGVGFGGNVDDTLSETI